jgi:hypothetical protein
MFDDLRDSPEEAPALEIGVPPRPKQTAPERRIFGMTAGQRFVLALLLLATVFVLGLSCLLVTERRTAALGHRVCARTQLPAGDREALALTVT